MKSFIKVSSILFMCLCLFSITSCDSDDDEELENDLVGTWIVVDHEGYESYDGDRNEFEEEDLDIGEEVIFRADGTVNYLGYEGEWSIKNGKLRLYSNDGGDYGDQDGDSMTGTIKTLTSSTLILEFKESDEDYEYYEKLTFERN